MFIRQEEISGCSRSFDKAITRICTVELVESALSPFCYTSLVPLIVSIVRDLYPLYTKNMNGFSPAFHQVPSRVAGVPGIPRVNSLVQTRQLRSQWTSRFQQ